MTTPFDAPDRSPNPGPDPVPDLDRDGDGDGDRPSEPSPAHRTRPRDPLAAALANASLLSVGYVLLRRWGTALLTVSVTAGLVGAMALDADSAWPRVTLPVWWAALTLHGWYLARLTARGPHPAAPLPEQPAAPPGTGTVAQRGIAVGAVAVVALTLVSFRVGAAEIERRAEQAHRDGDCERAVSLLEGLWAGHRLTDPGLVDRAEDSVAACELLRDAEQQEHFDRLRAAETLEHYEAHPAALWEGAPGRRADLVLAEAAEELDSATAGDLDALATGFEHLATVLTEQPGEADAVEEVMDGFLGALPTDDACHTRRITDWLAGRTPHHDVLERAADVVPAVAPAAIVACGDEALADERWTEARDQYRQLLDQYPGHDLAAQASAGVEEAETAIEFERFRDLLRPSVAGTEPAYCDDPVPYRGAEPYAGGGPHPALHFGHPDHRRDLPDAWRADGAEDAVIVICVGDQDRGSAVETCPYETDTTASGYKNVTFHNERFEVRVYEVRTGRLVHDTRVEVTGASCPSVIFYEYYGEDPGPPSTDYVTPTRDDVRDAYAPFVTP
ncbi:hypothetical protein ACTWP5_20940 [Streptomyces sp. 4N509B]|uniref:hypothetical protein n=1 Tax=Streptomyces sp. 4N509B TaxID=3457413 RepID=UPI003FD24A2C